MPVFDNNTGNPVTYRGGAEFTKEYTAGGYNFGKAEFVNVYKPDSPWEVSNVAIQDIQTAIGDGYLLESDAETAIREELGSEDGQNDMNAVGVAWKEFADGLFMGAPAAYAKYNDTPLEAYRNKLLSEEHKWLGMASWGMGTILGAVTPVGPSALVAKGAIGATRAAMGVSKVLSGRALAAFGKKGMTPAMADRLGKSLGGRLIKGVGTASVLGAAEMTPAALTEQYFGNTDRVGEMLGSGAVFNVAATGVFSAVAGSIKGVRAIKGMFAPTVANDAFVAASSKATGVDEKAIRYFQNNPVAAKNARAVDVVTAEANFGRDRLVADLAHAENVNKSSTSALKEIRRTTEQDMKIQAKAINPFMAGQISEDLTDGHKYFTTLTETAEDSLLAGVPGRSVDLSHVAKKLGDDIASLKGGGPEDLKVLAKLKVLKNQFKDGVEFDGMGTRGVLKTFRNETTYRGKFAPRDKPYERVVKGYAAEIRVALRETPGAEEYSKIMDQLSPKLAALEKFQKSMSSDSSRIGMAKILSKKHPSDAEFGKIQDFKGFMNELPGSKMKKYDEMSADNSLAADYLEDLGKRGKSDNEALRFSFDNKNFPDETLGKQLSDADLAQQQAAWAHMKMAIGGDSSLTPESLSKILLGSNQKKIDALNEFLDKIGMSQDDVLSSVMNEEFLKVKGSGSRFLNPNQMVGAYFGGPIGYTIGAVVDRFAGEGLRRGMTSKTSTWLLQEEVFGKISKKISGIADSILKPRPALARIKMQKLNLAIYRSALMELPAEDKKRLGISDTKPTAENVGDTKYQADVWKAMTQKFEGYDSRPETLMEEVEEKTASMAGDPDLARPMGEHIMRATSYLADVIPRDMSPPDPFAGPDDRWVPSDLDLDVFAQQVAAVQDPLSVVDALADGSITRVMTDAVAATSPQIMQMMQEKLMSAVATNPELFDYDTRLRAGFILDLPLEQTADARAFSFFQQTFAVVDEEGNIPSGGGSGFSPKLNSKSSSTWMSKSTKISNDIYT